MESSLRLFVSRRMGQFRVGASFGPRDFRRRGIYRQPTGDHVYVIEGRDAVKIGVAGDPFSRLAQLQTGSSHPLRVAWSTQVWGDAYQVEAQAHAMLNRHRIGGEWFDVPADVAVAAVSGAAYRYNGSRSIADDQKPETPWWIVAFVSYIALVPAWILQTKGYSQAGPCAMIASFALLLYGIPYCIRPLPTGYINWTKILSIALIGPIGTGIIFNCI